MQPVLEIRKLGERSYTYSVRATRSADACHVDLELTSFAECLRDAAQALTYFPRVHICYQGLSVGEQRVMRLESHPHIVACELLASYLEQIDLPPAPRPPRLQAMTTRVSIVP
jgi:hypothetical protein